MIFQKLYFLNFLNKIWDFPKGIFTAYGECAIPRAEDINIFWSL